MMIRDRYQYVQPQIMQLLHQNGGEMKFEDLYQGLRGHYKKFTRVQLAANCMQLCWNNQVIWEPRESLTMIEEFFIKNE